MERVCSKCGIYKNILDFSLNRSRRTHVCKQCESERVAEYQKLHKEQMKINREKWRATNKEKEFLENKATRLAIRYLKEAHPETYRECIDRARAEVGLKPSRKSTAGKLDNLGQMQAEHPPL